MRRPRICVIRTDGTNCDQETARAFELAGAEAERVHINSLKINPRYLHEYQILVIPGGFSYGDDVASGRILATEMKSFLHDELAKFVLHGNLIMGICNGFQALVQTGLLPDGRFKPPNTTLLHNTSGQFQCEWVDLQVTNRSKNPCVFTSGTEPIAAITLQIAHGEGRFFAGDSEMEKIAENKSAVLKYLDNPNGSLQNIAGICDSTGRIFGLMPHPERYVSPSQHPNWRREENSHNPPQGLPFFLNAVRYAAENL